MPDKPRLFEVEYSYNGSTTTTILHPRLPIKTGSDATAPTGTVHGQVVSSRSASRLNRISACNNNDWGSTAIFLYAGATPGATYSMVAMCHATFGATGGDIDFAADSGVPCSRVWQFDASGPTFVAELTDSMSAAVGDVTLFPGTEATTDRVIFGFTSPFSALRFSSLGGTAGVGGTVAWKYLHGGSWIALSGVTDGTIGFTATASHAQTVSWTQPTTWTPEELNGTGGALYYVAAEITGVYATNPIYSHVFIPGKPHTIPAGYVAAIGYAPNGTAQHGDHRGVLEFAIL